MTHGNLTQDQVRVRGMAQWFAVVQQLTAFGSHTYFMFGAGLNQRKPRLQPISIHLQVAGSIQASRQICS